MRSASLVVHGFSSTAEEEKFSKAEPGSGTYQNQRFQPCRNRPENSSAPTISFSMTPRFGENRG